MPEDSDLESRFEALRKEFVNEFQRTREIAHRLVDDFTAISGYAEIMVVRGGPENAISELRKILIARRNLWVFCRSAFRIWTNWHGNIENRKKTEVYESLAIASPLRP